MRYLLPAMSEPVDLTNLSPAERHRAVARRFGEVAATTQHWQAPTPVAGWVARDVISHLAEWFPAFLASGGVELPIGPHSNADPADAWRALASAVQDVLDDSAQATSTFTHPFAGTHQLDEAVDRFYTADVFMHTWDLARADGVDAMLDERFCMLLLEGMEPIDAMLRSSGEFGPRVPVADDADAVARLIAFIGRDPDWVPPVEATRHPGLEHR